MVFGDADCELNIHAEYIVRAALLKWLSSNPTGDIKDNLNGLFPFVSYRWHISFQREAKAKRTLLNVQRSTLEQRDLFSYSQEKKKIKEISLFVSFTASLSSLGKASLVL